MEENKGERKGGYVWLGILALLFGAMVYFYYSYPERDIGPKQPIYFSHRVHAGVKEIPCRFCHPGWIVLPTRDPPMEKCFYCHQYIIPQHPQIVKEKEHYDKGSRCLGSALLGPGFCLFQPHPPCPVGLNSTARNAMER